jgi:hypothetical protein
LGLTWEDLLFVQGYESLHSVTHECRHALVASCEDPAQLAVDRDWHLDHGCQHAELPPSACAV